MESEKKDITTYSREILKDTPTIYSLRTKHLKISMPSINKIKPTYKATQSKDYQISDIESFYKGSRIQCVIVVTDVIIDTFIRTYECSYMFHK